MDSHIMSNLIVIAIEKLEAKSLNIDDIINEFAFFVYLWFFGHFCKIFSKCVLNKRV